jgi:nitroreductase
MPEETIKNTIRSRTSWRTYDNKPLSKEIENELYNYIETKMETPFGTIPRFKIISTLQKDRQQLGTYGFVSGATNFIIGLSKNDSNAIQDFGYQLEKIILQATKNGLGTCWLGAFNRAGFSQVIDLDVDEIIPAIISIGYPSQERRLVGKTVRLLAGSTKRKKWSQLFFNQDFNTPLTHEEAGSYANALEMVRLGPSASNKQPWRIIKEKNQLHFYCQTKNYTTMQKLDMGIAMCHLELTLSEENINGKWINESRPKTEKKYVVTWTPD